VPFGVVLGFGAFGAVSGAGGGDLLGLGVEAGLRRAWVSYGACARCGEVRRPSGLLDGTGDVRG
jgi:hypothetical protein